MSDVVGIVLAAGAGSRMGRPKALIRFDDGTSWLQRACALLATAGCDPVIAVLGAQADQARALLGDPMVEVVVAADWATGLSASLAAGLAAARAGEATAAVITLVDLPELTAAALTRVLDRLGSGPDVIGRATYDARPGHPVLLGRDHWAAVVAAASADSGARDYLASAHAIPVECGDLGGGEDRDS